MSAGHSVCSTRVLPCSSANVIPLSLSVFHHCNRTVTVSVTLHLLNNERSEERRSLLFAYFEYFTEYRERNKSRSGHKTPIRGICISFPMFSEKDDNISDCANVSTITACGFDLARSESGRSGVSRND